MQCGMQRGSAHSLSFSLRPTVHTHIPQGWTPLISATSSGQEAIAAHLIGLGADVEKQNSGGRSSLHYAVGLGGRAWGPIQWGGGVYKGIGQHCTMRWGWDL